MIAVKDIGNLKMILDVAVMNRSDGSTKAIVADNVMRVFV